MLATGDIRTLKPAQIDALREVANIGAGHAATALSTMIGREIMITVPTLTLARLTQVPAHVVADESAQVAVVLLHVLGDLTGRSLLVFPTPTAFRLAELLLRRPRGSSASIGLLEQSALKECGNILCGAYLNALSDFMHLILLPSPPSLAVDAANTVLSPAFLGEATQELQVICVESAFQLRDDGSELRGYFLLLPDAGSLTTLLGAINRA